MAIADRKKREKERRSREILDNAESLFFASDFDDVSMDSIANRAELNKATLYLYYKNKESLFFAVALRGARRLAELVATEVDEKNDGKEMLLAVWTANLRFRKEHPEYARLYGQLFSGRFQFDTVSKLQLTPITSLDFANREKISESEDLVAMELVSLRRKMLSIVRSSIEKGILDRSLRKDLDPPIAATFLIALMDGMEAFPVNDQNIFPGPGIDKERYLQEVRRMIELMVTR